MIYFIMYNHHLRSKGTTGDFLQAIHPYCQWMNEFRLKGYKFFVVMARIWWGGEGSNVRREGSLRANSKPLLKAVHNGMHVCRQAEF